MLRLFVPDAPAPCALRLSRWRSDPLTRGAYSYVPPGASGADIAAISVRPTPARSPNLTPTLPLRPDPNPINQACHRTFYSTLHGAWLSGEAQAERILAGRCTEF